MKRKRITYAAPGLRELRLTLKVGKASMEVALTEGSATAGGSRPARFVSSDFITQRAIEASQEFRAGRIVRERVETLDEDLPILKPGKPEAPQPEAPQPPEGGVADATETPPSGGRGANH